ncbi:hypothetical protein BUALT_Bualt02G0242500 [Buddleja alternifolia]|uniref:Transmembrane protein n=1 Tax=Buddleja alternifolia TaxID=168488 RepID=A0AAV6Y9P2_9LAMI|nr:hypothetical protein BUALT_Bualt02G0242500 [Buddleja alternifolia]
MAASTQENIYPHKLKGGSSGAAAVKEGCRIIATTFLSLLLPLSFLLLARLSTARYFFLSVGNDKTPQPNKITLLTFLFLYMKTTLILNLLVSLVSVAALTHCLTGNKAAIFITQRRRSYAAWILLFLIQIFLSLGIHGTVDMEINSYTMGSLVLPRRLFLVLGLHETMVFWRDFVVKPAVDEAVFGVSREGFRFSWVEKVVAAVAFGNLWWRRLRDEAEALVVLPWIMAELRMDVGVADVVGWWLYYLTAAIGVVRVVKGFVWAVTWIFKYWPDKKERF